MGRRAAAHPEPRTPEGDAGGSASPIPRDTKPDTRTTKPETRRPKPDARNPEAGKKDTGGRARKSFDYADLPPLLEDHPDRLEFLTVPTLESS